MAQTKHTIILVHGIRTHADWFQRAKQVFSSLDDAWVAPIKYGRFDLIRFLLPGPWRRSPIEKSEPKILAVLEKSRIEGRHVTVIAHSNGTYVISELLKRNHLFKINNLILCGSVIDADYDWNMVSHKISGKIINDYGVKDIWPVVAHSITWGYGYSGTNGIGAPVEDRMHDTNHSAYFDPNFMRKYWLSFFRTGEIVSPRYDDDELPSSPWWFPVFEIPWKWAIVLAVTAILGWTFLPPIKSAEEAAEDDNAVVIAPPPSSTLFAYYEIGTDRRPTDVDGQLTLDGEPGPLPLFEDVPVGSVLKALSGKNLRHETTSNSAATTLESGKCVKVQSGPRAKFPAKLALSAGWLPVKLSACRDIVPRELATSGSASLSPNSDPSIPHSAIESSQPGKDAATSRAEIRPIHVETFRYHCGRGMPLISGNGNKGFSEPTIAYSQMSPALVLVTGYTASERDEDLARRTANLMIKGLANDGISESRIVVQVKDRPANLDANVCVSVSVLEE